MNFADARTIKLGTQIRFKDDYGVVPFTVPGGTTGTVVENRLDGVDPVLIVTLDETFEHFTRWGNKIHIRGPEEAFPVSIRDLAEQALDFEPDDKRVVKDFVEGRREAGDEGKFGLDDRYKIGTWANPVPFDVVDPPTTSKEARAGALKAELLRMKDAHDADSMSDSRYSSSGRMSKALQNIRAMELAIQAVT